MDLFNIEAEKVICGVCLFYPKSVEDIIEQINYDEFYSSKYGKIYQAISELFHSKQFIDYNTVADLLRNKGELDLIGGAVTITEAVDSAASPANIKYYTSLVRQLRNMRFYRELGRLLIEKSEEPGQTTELMTEIIDKAQLKIEHYESGDYIHVKDLMPLVMTDILADRERKGKLKGVPSGIPALDYLTSGFINGTYWVLGARPSVGKTASALQMIISAALQEGSVGFFSSEMDKISIGTRMLCNLALADSNALRQGMGKKIEYADLDSMSEKLSKTNIVIDDTPNINITKLESRARRMVKKNKVKIIFIDYIGLITHSNKNFKKYEVVSEISRRIKGLARELNIPIVALSQLGRDAEGKERPSMAKIRDSGEVEQDADGIILIHRPGEKDADEERLEFLLEKQRNGPVGIVNILHKKRYGRMVQVDQDGNEESSIKMPRYEMPILTVKPEEMQKGTPEMFEDEPDVF